LVVCAVALTALAVVTAAAVAAGSRTLGASTECLVPGTHEPLNALWHPNLGPAIRYTQTRSGDIAFAVRTDSTFAAYRPDHREWSASILKAMLLVAYLDRPSVADRALTTEDRNLLGPMITESDNEDADVVDEIVGASGLQALAARVGMHDFTAAEPIWGESEITARDQTTFFLHIDDDIVTTHRAYAMQLLAGIVPSERWGIGQVAPAGWQLYFKGGWGAGTGLIDSQVALLTRGCARVAVAVLTMHDPSHAYGEATLAGLFSRLLQGLAIPAARRPAPGGG
jgi:beta-lactamase class A